MVGYLNTRPLLWGLKRSGLMQHIDLTENHPAAIGQALMAGEIDLGLVPIALLPQLPGATIVSDFCIAANGPVASVLILSQVPLDQAHELLLDDQSRSSVALAQVLLRQHWKIQPQILPAPLAFKAAIQGTTAAVVIGDRALAWKNDFPFVYDLGQAWKDFTGLPFVFAAWVAVKPLSEDFLDAFNRANGYGLGHINEVVAAIPNPPYDLLTYFTQNIQYRWDEEKTKGMQQFLAALSSVDQQKQLL